jgi:hypothetical protein
MARSGDVEIEDLTTVLIGESKEEFVIQTDLLKAHFPFFRACMDVRMKEYQQRQVELPDDDPVAFQELLDIAYWGHFRKVLDPFDYRNNECVFNMRINTLLLADKMLAKEVQNKAMDSILEYFESMQIVPSTAVLDLVFESEKLAHLSFLEDLKIFMTQKLNFVITDCGGWLAFVEFYPEVHQWALEEVCRMEMFVRCGFMNAGLNGGAAWPYASSKKCELFHAHDDAEQCSWADLDAAEETWTMEEEMIDKSEQCSHHARQLGHH